MNNNKLETHDFICIDEISMTDGCTFDNIIERIKFINKYRKNDIKLNIVGDCMQLPPVDKSKSGYYFNGGEYDSIHKNSYFCILSEIKRQYNIEFIEILKRVRLAMHTKDDIKYIENMKNNKIGIIDNPIYMCALNKDVDEINKSYFNKNENKTFEFKKSVKYYSHIKDDVTEIKTLPINNMLFIKETTERGKTVFFKRFKSYDN